MKTYTLGFLFRNGKIILAKKKRKIGVGKWNGYGGGIEEGEDVLTSLVREIKEECGVDVERGKCKDLGFADFHHLDKTSEFLRVFVFRIDEFLGEPKETEEMGEPKEFDVKEIPYDEMIVGDDKFVDFVVEGKRFKGEFYYSEGGKVLVRYNIIELDPENSREIKLR